MNIARISNYLNLTATTVLGIVGALTEGPALQAIAFLPAVAYTVYTEFLEVGNLKSSNFKKDLEALIKETCLSTQRILSQGSTERAKFFQYANARIEMNKNIDSVTNLINIIQNDLEIDSKAEASDLTTQDVYQIATLFVEQFVTELWRYPELENYLITSSLFNHEDRITDLEKARISDVHNESTPALNITDNPQAGQKYHNNDSFTSFITSIKLGSHTTDALHFRSKQVGFYGRENETKMIEEFWAKKEKLLLYTICGEAGIGKSKLVFSFFESQLHKTDWKTVFCDYPTFKKMILYTDYAYEKNLCIAIDNAGRVAVEFAEWLSYVMQLASEHLPHKLRILLIERESIYFENSEICYPMWYKDIINIIGGEILRCITFRYGVDYGFMKLDGLNGEVVSKIVNDAKTLYADASYKVNRRLELNSLSPKEGQAGINPLYAIMQLDIAFNSKRNIQTAFFENMDAYLLKMSNGNKVMYDKLQILILYVTIVQPWQIGEEDQLPEYIQETVYYVLDNTSENDLKEFVCNMNKKEIFDGCLCGIEPDIIAEIIILQYMKRKSLNKRNIQKLIGDILVNDTISFVYFMTKCLFDFEESLWEKTIGNAINFLKRIGDNFTFTVSQYLIGKNSMHQMQICYFFNKIGVISYFDNRVILKAELMRLLLDQQTGVMRGSELTQDIMVSICLLRECCRSESDKISNPIYLNRAAASFREWGFSESICEIVKTSSAFVKGIKPIESFIISLIDIFGELVFSTEETENAAICKALDYIEENVCTLNENERIVKKLFIGFIYGK